MTHSIHKYPVYPFAHLTGWTSFGRYPPLQESDLGHSKISVELSEFLQYLLSTDMSAPPSQTAFGIQTSHFVEFHCNE